MADPVSFWAALQNLRGQSLKRTNPELKTISIHRFLQDQGFNPLCAEPSSRRRAFEESLFLLNNRQPEFPNVTKHCLLLYKSDLVANCMHRRYISKAMKIYMKQESSCYTVKAYARGARMLANAF